MITEIPKSEFQERVGRVQAELAESGLDALLTFGNEAEPAFVRYLSDYWPAFETAGVLVPVKGEPLLLIGPESLAYAQSRSKIDQIRQVLEYRENRSIYIVHSPGDEEFFGGCVSAGRGFAHITPTGDLTPCPVSNIATHNLTTATLHQGLSSPLFSEIRENEHLLETEGMPCALFAHPKEVDALAKAVGAYRANSEKSTL